MTTVLFVCTYWGVRSQIAKLLTEELHEEQLVAECAGFEAGVIGKLPREVMKQRGLDLSETSPPTLFNFARQTTRYDHVVTLCNQGTQENYQVLYDVVESLFGSKSTIHHWDVPDFMAIAAVEPDERLSAAEAIVGVIESQVREFARSYCPELARR